MLTPEQLESVADTLIPIWDNLKEWITLNIIGRIIARLGRGEDISLSASDEWELSVYQEAGGFLEDIQNRIAQTVQVSENEIRNIFLDYGQQAIASDNAVFNSVFQSNQPPNIVVNTPTASSNITIPPIVQNSPVSSEIIPDSNIITQPQTLPQAEISQTQTGTNLLNNISPRMKDIMQDAYERTNGELRNFTRTTANSYQQELIKELDNAYLKVTSNAQGQWQAAQEAINNVIKYQGYVTYPSGHVDTIEVAIVRAIRTGVARMSGSLAIENAKEYGWNHVLVSSHLGARAGDGTESPGNHEYWQGKVYTISGESYIIIDGEKVFAPNLEQVTGYPTDPTGLCGYNCRHNLTPFKEGMRNTFKQYDSEENKKAYDLTQRLRAYERNIRKAKTEVMALSEAVKNCTDSSLLNSLNDKLDVAKDRLSKLNKAYEDFCTEHKLKLFYERLYVARTPRTLEQLQNRNYYNNSANAVANSGESGIIKEKSKKEITPITDNAINSVPNVQIPGYTAEQCAYIREQHKELLNYSRSNNGNKEVAFVYDGVFQSRREFTGGDDRLDFGAYLGGKDLFVMHNHPRNSSFSTTDIDFFAATSNVKTLTIVKNNGKVEILTKSENFDISTFAKEYSRLYKKIVKTGIDSEKDKFVRTLLTKSKAGVIWNEV